LVPHLLATSSLRTICLHPHKAEHTKTSYTSLTYIYTALFPSEIAYTSSTSPIQSETVFDLYKSYMSFEALHRRYGGRGFGSENDNRRPSIKFKPRHGEEGRGGIHDADSKMQTRPGIREGA
jgi:hypothetical protein